MINNCTKTILQLSEQGRSILRTVNYKLEHTHDIHNMGERCKCYNLTQTILLVGKVTTVVQVVTSVITADTLPISQALEFLRKTLSTTRWFTYTQMWSNVVHPDYMKTHCSPNIKHYSDIQNTSYIFNTIPLLNSDNYILLEIQFLIWWK
jgi:hypothetical protein